MNQYRYPSLMQLIMLLVLATEPAMTGQQLAEAIARATDKPVPHGTFYTTLSRMEAQGLLQKCHGCRDGRLISYSLTQKGRDFSSRWVAVISDLVNL